MGRRGERGRSGEKGERREGNGERGKGMYREGGKGRAVVRHTIDQKEKGACLIGHRPGNKGLSGTGGTIEQDSPGGLYTDGPEQLGVTKGKFHHLEGDGDGHITAHTHV